jgi:CheY-like chemotaxis protein
MRHVRGESDMKEYADKTALIVDDDPDFLEQLEIQLTGLGFNVVTKDTQEAAQAYIQDHRPDIAFLDLMMENMDAGFVLSYAVKKRHPETPEIGRAHV